MKKLIMRILSCVMCISLLATAASATAWGNASAWGGETSENYLKNSSRLTESMAGDEITMSTDISFSAEQIVQINRNQTYATFEHLAMRLPNQPYATVKVGVYYQYSSLPGAHYDTDDDDGNLFAEESEVVILAPEQLSAQRDYIFSSRYNVDSSETYGLISIRTQDSVYDSSSGEYNTTGETDYYGHLNWGDTPSWALASAVNDTVAPLVTREAEAATTVGIISSPASMDELNSFVQAQYDQYEEVFDTQLIKTLDENEKTVRSNITLSAPTSVDEVADLLEESGATLINYHAKFINEAGDWCTLGGTVLNEDEMITVATEISEDAGCPVVSFEGITALEIEYPLDSLTYQTIRDSDLVYFIDMTEALELANDSGENIQIVPTLPDYSWKLAELAEE